MKNRTVVIKIKGNEIGFENHPLSVRFRELFCPLERTDHKFLNLFATQEEEENIEEEKECWFENLRPEDAELFVDVFLRSLPILMPDRYC